MTISPQPSSNSTDPRRSDHERVNLALSLVNHRNFCPDCIEQANLIRLALLGADIGDLLDPWAVIPAVRR